MLLSEISSGIWMAEKFRKKLQGKQLSLFYHIVFESIQWLCQLYSNLFLSVCGYVIRICGYTCHGADVEAREPTLLSWFCFHHSLGVNSGFQAAAESALPTEPSCLPGFWVMFNDRSDLSKMVDKGLAVQVCGLDLSPTSITYVKTQAWVCIFKLGKQKDPWGSLAIQSNWIKKLLVQFSFEAWLKK